MFLDAKVYEAYELTEFGGTVAITMPFESQCGESSSSSSFSPHTLKHTKLSANLSIVCIVPHSSADIVGAPLPHCSFKLVNHSDNLDLSLLGYTGAGEVRYFTPVLSISER